MLTVPKFCGADFDPARRGVEGQTPGAVLQEASAQDCHDAGAHVNRLASLRYFHLYMSSVDASTLLGRVSCLWLPVRV